MFTTYPQHAIFGRPLDEAPDGCETAYFAMGCYWGAEKLFWTTPGVVNTAVGFMGGTTPNPTYREACTGRTGHAETVRVVFDPAATSYAALLAVFYENHDPTQGDRQGADIGPQYRSAIFTTTPDQDAIARAITERFQANLVAAGLGAITTTIGPAGPFYYAEADHQQYLYKNPAGYQCDHRTGVSCSTSSSD